MIKFVEHTEIDRQKWARCLDGADETSVFARAWYLDAICDQWDALVDGDYKRVMPLPCASKLKVSYLFQPIFSRQLNVVGVEVDSEKRLEFLNAIPDRLRFRQFGFSEIEGELPKSWQSELAVHQQLSLEKDYETLFSAYSSNGKRNVKKARKADLQVALGGKPEDLVALFSSTKGGQLKELGETEYDRLIRLMSAAVENDAGRQYEVKNATGEVVAGGFFIKEGKTLLYLKGAANEQGKKSGAMHLLFDHVIQTGVSENRSRLDFGGSKVESVAKFYKNFGAIDANYLLLTFDRLPAWARVLKQLKD